MSIAEQTALDLEPIEAPISDAGLARIKLVNVAGRTVATQLSATSPLKLLNPHIPGSDCAWIFTSTYGGGLVGGDAIRLNIDAGPSTRCMLSTQASTKVYRTSGKECSQELDVSLDEDALFISCPDPIVCFDGAKYRQTQRFDLRSQNSSMIMVDWLTSGRRARGERWAFDIYRSQTEIFVDDRCIFRDLILLDPADGPVNGPMRMGHVDCFATIVIYGIKLVAPVQQLLAFVAAQPASGDPILIGASPISDGVVIRVAASDTEQVARWIQKHLAFVTDLVGHDPWSRKW